MTNNVNVPKLRFPEFEGEWERVKFKDLYEFKSTNSLSRDKLNYKASNVKNIHYGDIHTKFNSLFDIEKESVPYINLDVNLSKYSDDNYLKEGDIIIADASENYADIGKSIEIINLNKEKVLSGLHTFLARKKTGLNYNGFVTFIFKSEKYRKQIYTIAQGTKILSLSSSRVAETFFEIPSLLEQEKIVKFLSNLDKKIGLLSEKEIELNRYKKAMMQQLFSQELRFKDENGNDFAEWEEKRLGDIIEVKVGGTPSTVKPEYWNGNIAWINSGELKDKYIYKGTKYITELGLLKTSTFLLPINTVVLAMTGATLGKLGILKIESTANQSVAGFIPNIHFINEYLYYYLLGNQNLIFEKAGGAAQIGINKFNIESLEILFPSLAEQQKIANFLSSIDKSIEKVIAKKAEMQAFKKAMLQQMFV